jgi:hypothetical protein
MPTPGPAEINSDNRAMNNRRSSKNNNNHEDLSICIVWSPLHPITLCVCFLLPYRTYILFSYRFSCLLLIARFLPFIGHTGIADSRGVMHDFQGSYYVYSGNNGMAFGPPTRYLKIDIGDLPGGAERWVRYDDAARIDTL